MRVESGAGCRAAVLPPRAGCSALAVLALFTVALVGCGTLPNGERWGDQVFRRSNWERVPMAAKRALTDPIVLTTAAGAALFAIDDWDRKAVDWATDHNPVFGSEDSAGDVSDVLRTGLRAEALGTSLLTPSGERGGEWVWAKTKGLMVEGLTLQGTQWVTDGLKSATGRSRPFEDDDNAFPSAHTSVAAAGATLSNRNLDMIPMHDGWREALQVTNITLAAATGWARVEAGEHYPSDVLAGAALGRMLSIFLHDVFLGASPSDHQPAVEVSFTGDGAMLLFRRRF